jgi:hypothetical protein
VSISNLAVPLWRHGVSYLRGSYETIYRGEDVNGKSR